MNKMVSRNIGEYKIFDAESPHSEPSHVYRRRNKFSCVNVIPLLNVEFIYEEIGWIKSNLKDKSDKHTQIMVIKLITKK